MTEKITIPSDVGPEGVRNEIAALSEELAQLREASVDRGLTEAEESRHDSIKEALPRFKAAIDAVDQEDAAKIEQYKRRTWTPDGGQIDSPTIAPGGRDPFELSRGNAPRDIRSGASATEPGIGRRFEDLFGRPRAAEVDPGEFMSMIASGRFDSRLQRRAGHTLGISSEGGFLAPEPLSAQVWDTSFEMETVRPRATIFPMTAETLKVPGVEVGDHSSGALLGGITGAWLEEDETMSFEKAKLRLVKLQAHINGILTSTSNALDQDTMIADLIRNKFPQAMAWQLDNAFLNGNGAGQPLGVLNDPALIAVSKDSGQLAGTITYENLIAMIARLHPSLFRDAVIVANPTCIPQLLSISLGVGTAGVHFPALREDSGAWRLLTLPVLFSEKMPTIGSQGDILLVNFSQYLVGLRKDIAIDQSKHVLFDSNQTAFRVISRVDGQGAWNKVFTPKNGDTMSWCVVLEERS